MESQEIYFDNNSTTPTLPKVREEMLRALESCYGNPSSAHSAGERSRRLLWLAREKVSALVGIDPDSLYFTGGGTEANNIALLWVDSLKKRRRIITSSIEHSSILKTCEFLASRGVDVVLVDPKNDGLIDPSAIGFELAKAESALVSIQWVNNETGVIQPVDEIGHLCKEHGVIFHTDAAQAVGKIPISISDSAIDILTMTAHKVHGPQGVGAICSRNPQRLLPMIYGGPQESSLRPGTENLPGIAGFGTAADLRAGSINLVSRQLGRLRNSFEDRVVETVSTVAINGSREHRVCNTTNVRFTGVDGQAMVAQLDAAGIRCSQSSACTNQRPEPSYVLRAMGLSEDEAYECVRFSFSELNSEVEVETAVQAVSEISARLRSLTQEQPELVHERIAR